MCGIAGIVDIDVGEGPTVDGCVLAAMIDRLHHRGPDGTGFFLRSYIGLGHARLSIIDLGGGRQPIHNEDKTIWIVFNGEIFNYLELRSILEGRGHQFYTRTDTEVIVHLYEEFGEKFLDHLNGQFAIALWNDISKTLLLARDRAGILPLYYCIEDKRLVFASEVKAVLPALRHSPSLNIDALDQLMTFWAPVSPETMFSGIHSLSPGECLRLRGGQTERWFYWDWAFPTREGYREGSEEALAEELHELLRDATVLRLRSDVPVGAYLSGGLDSSVLVALIRHHGDVPLRTFSIGFDDEKLDETRYQELVIRHIGTDHSMIRCNSADITENFLRAIWHAESPMLRAAPVPMAILSRLVRESDYKVVLTGEGADEVLGGYDLFKEAKIRQFWARYPNSQLRPLLLQRLYPYLDLPKGRAVNYLRTFFGEGIDQPGLAYFSHLPRWTMTARCKEFFSLNVKSHLKDDAIDRIMQTFPSALKSWESFNKSQYIEAKSLMAGYLLSSQGDRMLMSHSVEGRFPFLDHRVIEFANSLRPSLKMKVLNEKYLLKQAMSRYVPAEIIERYKQPYRAPDAKSFVSMGSAEYVNELMCDSAIRSAGYFDEKKVALLANKIKSGRMLNAKDNMAFMGVLSTQAWHHIFVDNNVPDISRSNIGAKSFSEDRLVGV